MPNRRENNLSLWNRVSQTPPEYVKPMVGQPYLSAIDAYYQIEKMTEEFGIAGKGWGYDIKEMVIGKSYVKCTLVVWYVLDNACYQLPPVIKMQSLYKGSHANSKIDEDACAKLITNCLTKSISLLGFNADVFQGKHNKINPVVSEGPPPIDMRDQFRY